MGVGVSGWRLAKAVSTRGHLGVVSGTALDSVLARRLQLGDPEGHLRRALAAFPVPGVAQRILENYFIPGGKPADQPFRIISMPALEASRPYEDLCIAGSFAEVFLAKENHNNPVGINLLEKIQTPTLHALFGAMLAGVDYVLMGAGIPRQIPGLLDQLALGQPVEMRLDVAGGTPAHPAVISLDPMAFFGCPVPPLQRPRFLAIVSSPVLADSLLRKSSGKIDGFIVESSIAGGHNAPPRGPMKLTDSGEPLYGPRDIIDPEKFRQLGLPFWLAGGYGRPGKLAEAQKLGATGIQVGTAFAFCEESGLTPELKRAVLKEARAGRLKVHTAPCASPTGFPFKMVELPGTLTDQEIYEQRDRVCDVGQLRQTWAREDGKIGFRCPAEPIDNYIRKGGKLEDACGRQCLCNSLLAAIGLGQVRSSGDMEAPLVTAGDDAADLAQYLPESSDSYTAADVLRRLTGN